ncbi:hypothetical protein [Sphingomonas albertensis]|uniref:Bacterial surface antigen (D15) domain-containing protein n=1 Tax=Sphingomonas albertensis TaxID=2762591 RepID=A0ABR7AQ64_9SPHN|nr:hypothetical protein [Sphingomonas albertensis]MBC3942601.1 hypothetical protein [Sphingomonas albertensis]
MKGGRPLRFLALSLGGWVMIRVALLLPEVASLPASEMIPRVIDVLVPQVAAAVLGRSRPMATVAMTLSDATPSPMVIVRRAIRQPISAPAPSIAEAVREAPQERPHVDAIPSPVAPPMVARRVARLSGSAWLLARGGPAGTVSGGQLGASQGGLRLVYALGDRRRFALVARVATPLEGKGREAAVGIEWQPTRLPIRLVAEQRFVLDGGRGGPTLGVIAGYGPSDIAPGVRVEAYGQAGGIVRDGIEGFVDASARLTHPLGKVAGARVDVGVGAWGSAQRDASRFDIGPSIVATLPVAGKTLRLTLDWRERIAGGARPGSGPALSIGSDF